jgi:hypothetical protein
VHPSRHGTYDGISMHPYEVVFLKTSWHVGEPFADKYAAWQSAILRGETTTSGSFDEAMYFYAIQCALAPSGMVGLFVESNCCGASALACTLVREVVVRVLWMLQALSMHAVNCLIRFEYAHEWRCNGHVIVS